MTTDEQLAELRNDVSGLIRRVTAIEAAPKPPPSAWETTILPWLTSKTAIAFYATIVAGLSGWFAKPPETKIIEKEVPARVKMGVEP